MYNDSFLKLRIETSINEGDAREKLASNAIDVFASHPFTGVGPGQFYLYSYNHTSFSHNSFTEIAANMGIIGLILFLLLLFSPLFKEIKNYLYNKGDKSIIKLNILFFLSFILINNIYVFYLTTYGMMFFFLIVMIQKKNNIKYRFNG